LGSEKEWKMYEFTCGHQECGSQFTSQTKDDLMGRVKDHLKDAHAVQTATQTLLGYLETHCVTTAPD
jgi:predicted small metal-binding protein